VINAVTGLNLEDPKAPPVVPSFLANLAIRSEVLGKLAGGWGGRYLPTRFRR